MKQIIEKTKSVDLSKETLGNVQHLQCLNCSKIYTLTKLKFDYGTTLLNICYEGCLGPLALIFDLSKISISRKNILLRPKKFSLLQELLPFENKKDANDFPFSELRYSEYFSNKHKLQVYLKLDMDLPSGSFKDRPVLASFKRAKETGYNKVYVASTGNLAISCLRLGKEFGFEVKVYLSNTLNKKRRKYIEQFADDIEKQIITVNGSYDDANILAIKDCEEQNKKDLISTGQYRTFVPNYSFRPYYKEGSKTSGFEIALQLLEQNISEDINVHIFYPLGSGALISSAYKGISELNKLGIFKNKTYFYGIQQKSLNPIVKAYRNGELILPQIAQEHLVREIAIGNPGSGTEVIKLLNTCNGDVEDVSDEETLKSFLELYRNENLFPQACGAMTLRGFEKIHARKNFNPTDIVVINITGDGKGKIEDDLLKYSKEFGLESEFEKILEGGQNG